MTTKTRIVVKTVHHLIVGDTTSYQAQYLKTLWLGFGVWLDIGHCFPREHRAEYVIDMFLETKRPGFKKVETSIIEYPRFYKPSTPPGDE